MSADARFLALPDHVPTLGTPPPARRAAVRTGNLLYTSGHGPMARPDGTRLAGKIGRELTVEEGVVAARETGIILLAVMRAALGSLDRVTRVVKVLGMVNVAPGVTAMPKVMDGFSELCLEVFGPEVGPHARSAVGVAELPLDYPVEIEVIVEVRD
ncbi:MAG: RidA family protein [Chloroflexota bacterium]